MAYPGDVLNPSAGGGVTSFNTRAGAVTLTKADVTATGLAAADVSAAPLASPALTGNPTAPTQAANNNSTRLATTAYVDALAAATLTLTNKRITRRVSTVNAPGATPSVDIDNFDQLELTGVAAAITSITVSGTPAAGDRLFIAVTDDGTSRAITLGASFKALSIAAPTATTISQRLVMGFLWDPVASLWDLVGWA